VLIVVVVFKTSLRIVVVVVLDVVSGIVVVVVLDVVVALIVVVVGSILEVVVVVPTVVVTCGIVVVLVVVVVVSCQAKAGNGNNEKPTAGKIIKNFSFLKSKFEKFRPIHKLYRPSGIRSELANRATRLVTKTDKA
jgi:hypothetical protein